MMDLKEFQEWKQKIEGLQRQADRAAGALDQLHQRLMDEFRCGSLAEAERLLDGLVRDLREVKEGFDQAKAEFEKRWGKQLEG